MHIQGKNWYGSIAEWVTNGPKLLRDIEIEYVHIRDKEPTRFFSGGSDDLDFCEDGDGNILVIDNTECSIKIGFSYRCSGVRSEKSVIPKMIFLEMVGGDTISQEIFDSYDLANDALSIGCLEWAKSCHSHSVPSLTRIDP